VGRLLRPLSPQILPDTAWAVRSCVHGVCGNGVCVCVGAVQGPASPCSKRGRSRPSLGGRAITQDPSEALGCWHACGLVRLHAIAVRDLRQRSPLSRGGKTGTNLRHRLASARLHTPHARWPEDLFVLEEK
jgi:hypothetical protein